MDPNELQVGDLIKCAPNCGYVYEDAVLKITELGFKIGFEITKASETSLEYDRPVGYTNTHIKTGQNFWDNFTPYIGEIELPDKSEELFNGNS